MFHVFDLPEITTRSVTLCHILASAQVKLLPHWKDIYHWQPAVPAPVRMSLQVSQRISQRHPLAAAAPIAGCASEAAM